MELPQGNKVVEQWWLMGSPIPLLAITATYILFVVKVGPDYMKSRPAMGLNKILGLYNAVQVIVSFLLLVKGVTMLATNGLVSSECKTDQLLFQISEGIYQYHLVKITELLDTVFFVLRKKQKQVTFLHVYHHTVMIWNTWIGLKYDTSYTLIFLGTVNSFIHVIMYTYYGLSAFPSLRKYLWWKKYLTRMQLIQFVAVILHAVVNYLYGCPISTMMFFIVMFNAVLFTILFGDFYVKSYLKGTQINAKRLSKQLSQS